MMIVVLSDAKLNLYSMFQHRVRGFDISGKKYITRQPVASLGGMWRPGKIVRINSEPSDSRLAWKNRSNFDGIC